MSRAVIAQNCYLWRSCERTASTRCSTVIHVLATSTATVARRTYSLSGARTRPVVITTTRSARLPKPTSPLQPERLGLGPRVADEERAGQRGERERDAPFAAVAHEDERDRAEHEALADPVDGRVDERAERRSEALAARERAVEDVEDRAEHEERGAEPEAAPALVLEVDGHGSGDAEPDAGGGQRVRRELRAAELRHRRRGGTRGRRSCTCVWTSLRRHARRTLTAFVRRGSELGRLRAVLPPGEERRTRRRRSRRRPRCRARSGWPSP